MHENISFLKRVSCLLFIGVLPLWPILSSLALIPLIALCLIDYRKTLQKRAYILLWFTVPFIGYFISFFYSYDMYDAGLYLIRILPILVLPVLFVTTDNNTLPSSQAIKTWFVYGMLISMGFALVQSSFDYLRSGDILVFTYYDLAENMKLHPTYFSLYALTALHFLWNGGFKSGFRILGSICLLIFLLLLQSKAGYLILALMISINLIFVWKLIWVRFVILTTLLFVFALLLFKQSTRITEDMRGLGKIDEPLIGIIEENGVTQRMWLLKEALPQIKEKLWIGHGLKSQRKLFRWKVHKNGLLEHQSFAYRQATWNVSKLNLHNQYLQVLYEGGIIGLVLFIVPLGIIFYRALTMKNWLFLFPYAIFLLILTTENLLDRQMGIYYYAVFLPLLYLAKESPMNTMNITYNKYRLR